jgi:hypothetical protein
VRYPFTATKGVSLDIDIAVLATPDGSEQLDPKEIKRSIRVVDADSRYYLQPSKRLCANFRVLFFRLPRFRTERRCIEVDILIALRTPGSSKTTFQSCQSSIFYGYEDARSQGFAVWTSMPKWGLM